MQKCNIFWLFKRLLSVFFFFPLLLKGQISYDFERNDSLQWQQSPGGSWELTADGALAANKSLRHAHDNPSAGKDKAGFLVNGLDLEPDTVVWQFQVKHGYDPSGANNWAFYLTSDKHVSYMGPENEANGYVVGVNFKGYDDLLQLWKINQGETTLICQTSFNWQQEVGTERHAGIRVLRYPGGRWKLLVDKNGGFDTLQVIGEAMDDQLFPSYYAGVYFQYTSSRDLELWLDDVFINGTFIPDTLPPKISSSWPVNKNTLELSFSEPVDHNSIGTGNFFIPPGKVPTGITFNGGDKLTLHFLEDFTADENNLLVINRVKDMYGNTLEHDTIQFVHHLPKPGDIAFTEIMADPLPVVNLPDMEYVEIQNISAFTINLENWTISTSSVQKHLTKTFLIPGERVILCHADAVNDFEEHGEVMGIFTSVYTLPNGGTKLTLFSPDGLAIDSVNYFVSWHGDEGSREGGYSLEKIDVNRFCAPEDNWTSSVHPNGGTPGTLNSVNAFNPDTLAPQILKAEMDGDTIAKIFFNETLDEMYLSNENFVLGGLDNQLDSFLYLPGESLVKLCYREAFPERKPISIRVQAIADKCGNYMNDTLLSFTLNTARSGDIVINEIMADPNPVVGLPEYEYLELYNNSNYPVNLNDWQLIIGRYNEIFSDITIMPGNYLIVCSNEATTEFIYQDKVVGLFTGTFLRNSGDTIKLINKAGLLIDITPYFPDYHRDENKRAGGYSLERISADDTCGRSSNWTSTMASLGGTPGMINSVYRPGYDTMAPYIMDFKTLGDTGLELSFSEELQHPVNWNHLFELNNTQPDTVIAIDDNHTSFVLNFDFPFPDTNTLLIKNINDVCGNIVSDSTITFYYREGEMYDILITEIMADPSPVVGLPEIEYIEIYNSSKNDLDIEGWKLSINNNVITLPDYELKNNEYLILTDSENEVLIDSSWNFLLLDNLPALPNSGGEIILKNKKNKFIHGMRYYPSLHEEIKQSGGWSIELLYLNHPCMVDDNWRSSGSPSGGTPSAINAVQLPENSFSPAIKRIEIKDDSLLAIYFTHSIPEIVRGSYHFFKVIPGMDFPEEIMFMDSLYTSIALKFNNPFTRGILYRLEMIRDITTCTGEVLEFACADEFTLPYHPEPNELVINEILFNPVAEGYDFIEIYNKTDKTFDAADMYLSKRDENYQLEDITKLTQQSTLVRPGDYLVVTENIDWLCNHYTCDNKGIFIQNSSMPPFPDKEGRVVLTDTLYNAVDEMIYEESMHFGMLISTEGVSLERINPDHGSLDRENWHSAAQTVGFATPGYQNSQYSDEVIQDKTVHLEPDIFSPDNDGVDDRLNIHYQLDKPGYLATIMIHDARGRRVRLFADRLALDREGMLTWDGITDEQYLVLPGIYVVYIELFHPDGEIKKYKKTCVRGGRY